MSMHKLLCCTVVLSIAGSAMAASTVSNLNDPNAELYGQLKKNGEEIPAWLHRELFPNAGPGHNDGQRAGGDIGNPTSIANTAFGTVFNDSGDTSDGNTDDLPVGTAFAGSPECNYGAYSSSFGAPDEWYTFTLSVETYVSASTCNASSFDTCLGILDAAGNLVAVNDDGVDATGAACPGFTSNLEGCCLEAGTYYLVVDGYDASSLGAYELEVTFNECPAAEPFACPTNSILHIEGDACGDFVNSAFCNSVFCGEIDDNADVDYYWLNLPTAQRVIINVFGDDTFGEAPYGFGADPYIQVIDFAGFACGAVLYENDDVSGTNYDSFLDIGELPAGDYYLAIGTNWDAPGPYVMEIECNEPCQTPEDNEIDNPIVLTDENDWTNYQGFDNRLTVPVDLCNFCSNLNIGPGTFSNGHTIEQLDGGEVWLNMFQPDFNAQCYALVIAVGPPYADIDPCTQLLGVGQNGNLLGWFPSDPSDGILPSIYWNDGTMNSTFVVDAPAACCDQITIEVWYEDLCPPPANANDVPVDFALGQNYPNPFNPSTTIDFTLPETGMASLKVYGLNGAHVATIAEGTMDRGAHSVSFDASNLSSGVYFYTLEANGVSETRKMVLMK